MVQFGPVPSGPTFSHPPPCFFFPDEKAPRRSWRSYQPFRGQPSASPKVFCYRTQLDDRAYLTAGLVVLGSPLVTPGKSRNSLSGTGYKGGIVHLQSSQRLQSRKPPPWCELSVGASSRRPTPASINPRQAGREQNGSGKFLAVPVVQPLSLP